MPSEIAEFKDFTNDLKWLSNNLDALRPEYQGKYVLVKNGHVLLSDSSYDTLIGKALERNIELATAVIEKILPANIQLLL